MPVTQVIKDPEAVTMTIVAEFPAPVQRVWDAYADPRQIEKFWGPVEWPATFTRHDFAVGGRSEYHMTGPNGEISAGRWTFLAVDPPRSFEVEDGFRNPDGTENTQMPTMRMIYLFEEIPGGTRVTNTTWFPSAEVLEQMLGMGMEEGALSAMSQMDDVIADLASYVAGVGTQTQILSDTLVRITRIVRGTPEQVWRAYTQKDLVQRWMLGPDGWTMPVCDIADAPGEKYRYEWESADGSERFGFEGELLEAAASYRQVSTENMIGVDGPGTVNELTLTPVAEGTLVTTLIHYPSAEMRDMVLATGMADGMEASFARLEAEALV